MPSRATRTPTGPMRPRNAETYPKADLDDPANYHSAVRNVLNVHDATPDAVRAAGLHWYEDVNQAVSNGVRGTSMTERSGAGIVAAVSPGMDFEQHNIQALHDIRRMRVRDWAEVHRSAEGPQSGRLESTKAMLLERAPSLARASDAALVKAHRIVRGEDPEEVLPRQTSPKTNSFFHNIHEPDVHGPVTIDGRAHDIAINRMTPWNFSGRGIQSASTARGNPTRYERLEGVYRDAAAERDMDLPHPMQAVTWMGGKHLEQSVGGGVTKKGKPRVQGPARLGQPYM